jgi:tetratricopeptide (TPR) repeat protein
LLGIGLMTDPAAADEEATCLSASGQTAVSACQKALRKDPSNMDIRMALGEALLKLRRYRPAVDVFKAGLEMEPGNRAYKEQLALVESLLKEQAWIEKQRKQRALKTASGQNGKKSVAASRFILRCTKLKGNTALAACNEGLALFPGLAELYRGKGDALMDLNRIGQAILAYREALVLVPDHRDTERKLSMAQTRRRLSVKKCTQLTGIIALSACDAALIKGGPDELIIQQRRGDLLSAMGKRQAAIEAYQAALMIDSGDNTIQRKLAALGVVAQQPTPSAPPTSVESVPEKPTIVAAVDPKPKAVASSPKTVAPSPRAIAPPPKETPRPPKAAAQQPNKVKVNQQSKETPKKKKTALPLPEKLAIPTPEKAASLNSTKKVARVYSNGPVAAGVTH